MISRSIGSGPDLALIHGWGLGDTVWAPVVDTLAQRCRVHLLTLPGYGMAAASMDKRPAETCREEAHEQTLFEHTGCRSPIDAGRSQAAGTTLSFVQTAAALVDTLPDGCTLCGWSLGGMLALQAALLAPQRCQGLILIGSTPSFTQRTDWPHAQPPALLDTFSHAIREDAATTLQRFIALLNQGDAQARVLGRAMLKQLLASELPDTPSLLNGLDWLRDVDLRAQSPSLSTPTLLIHGEHDPLMPLAAAQWLADELPQARLETFAATAHATFLADPARFATLVGNFCHDTAR